MNDLLDEIDFEDWYDDYLDQDDGTEHPLVHRIFTLGDGFACHVRAVVGDEITYTMVGDDRQFTCSQEDVTVWFDDDDGGHCPFLKDDESKFCWDCGQTR